MLKFITIAIITSFTLFGAEGDKPTPQPLEVINALAPLEKSVVANYKAYQSANAKELDKAIVALEAAFKKAMLKEDLEGSILIKKAIEGLKNGDTVEAIIGNYKKQLDLLGTQVDLKKIIVGKWKTFDGTLATIDNKMKVVHASGITGSINIKNNIVTLTWANGWKQIYSMYDEKTKIFTGKHIKPNGDFAGEITLTKND